MPFQMMLFALTLFSQAKSHWMTAHTVSSCDPLMVLGANSTAPSGSLEELTTCETNPEVHTTNLAGLE